MTNGVALGSQLVRDLHAQAFTFYRRVNKLLKQKYNCSFGNRFSLMNTAQQVKLLRLRTWHLRYKVPVSVILEILITYWQAVHKYRRTSKATLGIPLVHLVSNKSAIILQEKLAKQFPQYEHLDSWRAVQRQRYFASYRTLQLVGLNPVQLVSVYQTEIHKRRKRMHYQMTVAFRRRRYPENPWL